MAENKENNLQSNLVDNESNKSETAEICWDVLRDLVERVEKTESELEIVKKKLEENESTDPFKKMNVHIGNGASCPVGRGIGFDNGPNKYLVPEQARFAEKANSGAADFCIIVKGGNGNDALNTKV